MDMNRLPPRIAVLAALALAPFADVLACSSQSFLGSVCATSNVRGCPKNTLPADGQLLSIAGNSALFSLLGTTYGGNGTTTFALPDLRGRVVVTRGQGRDLANREVGQQLGSLDLQIAEANLPPHNHPASSEANVTLKLFGFEPSPNTSYSNYSDDPAGKTFASIRNVSSSTTTTTYGYSGLPADVDMDASAVKVSATVTTTLKTAGGGQPLAFGNAQPTLVMTYCIVTDGIFPNYQ
jgi:microcystin-dependent protein